MALKCNSCKTYVTKIPVNWKCPHCGEQLPEPTKWFLFVESSIEGLQDKGAIFWSIWFGVLVLAVGFIELFAGRGELLGYLVDSLLLAILGISLGGILIDMSVRIHLPIRLPYGTDFIIRERAGIRNIRKATLGAIVLGLITALSYGGISLYFEYFPAVIVIVGWYLAFAWSIAGLFLDPRWLDDVRFRFYLERLGIFSLKHFRRLATIMIGALVMIAIGFNVLLNIPGIWLKLRNIGAINAVVHFIELYLDWLV
ncbi:MAG: hypothetical protein FJY67_00645 [Calditrichaeota bacterium]|nr:hypothetical protein [Calditrichota bacterium]